MDADDDRLVTLVRAGSAFEADTIVARLSSEGIRAYAAHRRLEDVFPTLFSEEGVAVRVRAIDVAAARAALGT